MRHPPARAVDFVDSLVGAQPPHGCAVIAAVEVQGVDFLEQTPRRHRVQGRFQQSGAGRLAAAATHPSGMPRPSHATGHFQPDLALSQGFEPVPDLTGIPPRKLPTSSAKKATGASRQASGWPLVLGDAGRLRRIPCNQNNAR